MTTFLDSLKIQRTPPDGAFTAVDAATHSGLSKDTAQRKCRAAVAAGTLLCGVFKPGRHMMTYYWEPKPAATKVRCSRR